MIRFDGIRVRYRAAASPAVDGVTFEALRGEMTALVGPNGSGKSTLVRALIRRQALEAGRISVDGADLREATRRELARRVAVVTQREEPVFPLRVRDYIALGRYPHAGPWGGERSGDRPAIDQAVELAGVRELIDRDTSELSGGEWQRVRIARALAQGGEALVLDEPTTFLDVAHEMALFELLDSLARRGLAVLLVSHQLNLVARFATSIILLHHGRVAAIGAPPDVMQGATLEHVYGWPLVVIRDPAVGAPVLLPLRSSGPA